MKIISLPETDSTNRQLHAMLVTNPDLAHGTVVAADHQTDGHGQGSNRWESAPYANILASLLLRPTTIAPSLQFTITQIVTLAICRLLDKYLHTPASIKWPNDIYINDKKICGLLIENSITATTIAISIVGIGLNVNQTEFLSDAPNPVSMRQIEGHDFDRHKLLEELTENILDEYQKYADSIGIFPDYRTKLHQRYMSRLYRAKGLHPYRTPTGETFHASIHSIDPQGRLTLQLPDSTLRHFYFKEVAFVI